MTNETVERTAGMLVSSRFSRERTVVGHRAAAHLCRWEEVEDC